MCVQGVLCTSRTFLTAPRSLSSCSELKCSRFLGTEIAIMSGWDDLEGGVVTRRPARDGWGTNGGDASSYLIKIAPVVLRFAVDAESVHGNRDLGGERRRRSIAGGEGRARSRSRSPSSPRCCSSGRSCSGWSCVAVRCLTRWTVRCASASGSADGSAAVARAVGADAGSVCTNVDGVRLTGVRDRSRWLCEFD